VEDQIRNLEKKLDIKIENINKSSSSDSFKFENVSSKMQRVEEKVEIVDNKISTVTLALNQVE